MSIIAAPALSINPTRDRFGLRAPKGGCRVGGRFFRGGTFCLPYDPSNPIERPVVQVAGDDYLLEIVDPGSTYSAVRLTKRVSENAYRVERHRDGHVSCECKGYEFRGTCRHVSHAMVHGLVPPPPVAEAPAVEPEPAAPAARPQHGWPSWTDRDRWSLVEDGPAPSWDADRYEPTASDWREFFEWSRSIDPGVPVDALTIEEMEVLTFTMTEREFREVEAEYDACKDAEDAHAEVWS